MSWYIKEDGKTVTTWTLVGEGTIKLADGTVLEEEDYAERIFAVDPEDNSCLHKDDDGVFIYTSPLTGESKSMKKKRSWTDLF